MKRLIYIIIVIIILLPEAVSCRREKAETSPYLATLDSLIDKSDKLEQDKLLRIAELRRKEQRATTPADHYINSSMLFDEFATYRSDSAIKYIDRCINIAHACGNKDWENNSKIAKIGLLAGTGLILEAQQTAREIDTIRLSRNQMIDYYGQLIYLFSHLGNYARGSDNQYYAEERAFKDSVMTIISPSHPDYLWYKSWDIIGTSQHDLSLVDALRNKVDSSRLESRQDAKEAYVLAKLYEHEGDKDMMVKYMAISAIADVKIANAEIASLIDLARLLFKNGNGDIDRAYNYINYSLNKAITYPDRVRAVGVTNTLDAVNKAYQQRTRHEQQRTRNSLILVCVLAVILICSVVIIITQNRRLSRQGQHLDKANKSLSANLSELSMAKNQLSEANSKLKELNADLKQKNDELNEANYVKEEYIGYIFTICSNYIGRLEELRRSIHVKALQKKYKEIIMDTDDSDTMRDELKDFYRSFDTVFLHIYPDFVSDFNSLLQDDKHITPKEGELLNTELRIYALVRLGITDSIKIAEFLHCSPQTVYNNRFRVRNKAIVPKKNFAETVRTLGKFTTMPS